MSVRRPATSALGFDPRPPDLNPPQAHRYENLQLQDALDRRAAERSHQNIGPGRATHAVPTCKHKLVTTMSLSLAFCVELTDSCLHRNRCDFDRGFTASGMQEVKADTTLKCPGCSIMSPSGLP